MSSRAQYEAAAQAGTRSYEGEELEVFRYAARWKAYWSDLIRPFIAGEVLEVGAGIGGSTEWLAAGHQGGWLCLEPDEDMAREIRDGIAAERIPGRVEVLCCQLSGIPESRRFDTVIYIDVLEHIEDDTGELGRAAALLKPGGRIIVLAPAYQWLFSPFDASVGHFRRYSAGTLDRVAPPETARIAYGYIDCLGLPLSLANRVLLRQANPAPWQIRFWDRCLVPLSQTADRLHGGSIGKTLISIYEKPGNDAEARKSPAAKDSPLNPDKAQLLTKAKRFGVVGILATLIHVAIFGLLVDVIGWNAPTPATGIAFLAATTFSYFTNYRWTFGTPGKHSHYMPRFFTVTTSLFLLNLLIMHASVAWFSWHHWIGLAIVISVVPASSFLLNTFWAFGSTQGRVSSKPGKS